MSAPQPVTRHASQMISVMKPGMSAELLVENAPTDLRPFVHPLRAPDGNGVLTEDRPDHHPWQHGLYIGLNDVNGVGFWMEGLHEPCRETDGTFHPRPLEPPEVSDGAARWRVVTEYCGPAGDRMMTEEQRWTLTLTRTGYLLDLDWELKAGVDLRFGRYDYGGLFLRMPWRPDVAAGVLTSEGISEQARAEAQRARWVAVHMNIDGRPDPAGIVIMDHPQNPGHPVTWRVDGQYGYGPNRCIAGAWELRQGERTVSRYRVIPFCGVGRADRIERDYEDFAAKPRGDA